MFTRHITFIDHAIRGQVLDIDKEIDDAIEVWHTSNTGMELYEFLGLTREEYAKFVIKPSMLKSIIEARIPISA
jgi:hypothetical protein